MACDIINNVLVCKKTPAPASKQPSKSDHKKVWFDSLTLGGQMAIPSFIRQIGNVFLPTYGGSVRGTVGLSSGDKPYLRFATSYTPLTLYPSDAATAYQLDLGLRGSSKVFRLKGKMKNFGADTAQADGIAIRVQTYKHAKTSASLGVESYLGVDVVLSQYFSLGLGMRMYSELFGSGPNRVPYNMVVGANLQFNFHKGQERLSSAALTRLQIARFLISAIHAYRLGETARIIGGLDGMRDKGLDKIVHGVNVIHHARIAYNAAELGRGVSKPWAKVLTVGYFVAGAALMAGGIAGDQPELAGSGSSLFAAGPAAMLRAIGVKQEKKWYYALAMMVGSLIPLGIGLGLYLKNRKSLNPIIHRQPGEQTNPHSKTNRLAISGLNLMFGGGGGGILGGLALGLTGDPRPGRPQKPTGGVLTAQFQF